MRLSQFDSGLPSAATEQAGNESAKIRKIIFAAMLLGPNASVVPRFVNMHRMFSSLRAALSALILHEIKYLPGVMGAGTVDTMPRKPFYPGRYVLSATFRGNIRPLPAAPSPRLFDEGRRHMRVRLGSEGDIYFTDASSSCHGSRSALISADSAEG